MKFIEKVAKAFYILKKNPRLFLKYIIYRLKRLGPKWRKEYRGIQTISIGDVKFQIDFDTLGSNTYTKQVYFSCYELHVAEIMKRYLKKGGVFIDVGANIGYISALGASLVGENGFVVSFEPVPHVFNLLEKVASLNPHHKIVLCNKAISENNTQVVIDCTLLTEPGGSTAVRGFLDTNNVKTREKVIIPAVRLDQYFFENNIDQVSLIKIDVEGYEFSVLRSLENYFINTPFRPIIICELAPKAFELLGFTIKDLFDYMSKFGYQPFDAYDCKTNLTGEYIHQTIDVVFIPNVKVI